MLPTASSSMLSNPCTAVTRINKVKLTAADSTMMQTGLHQALSERVKRKAVAEQVQGTVPTLPQGSLVY